MPNSTSSQPKQEGPLEMDGEFYEELIQTFLLEFEELMELYKKSLMIIRKPNSDYKRAYSELFRVYHTLKGDSGFFKEFGEFTNFTSHYCDLLRPLNKLVYENDDLLAELSLNYSRLSTALFALNNGRSLQAFRFKIFLRNF